MRLDAHSDRRWNPHTGTVCPCKRCKLVPDQIRIQSRVIIQTNQTGHFGSLNLSSGWCVACHWPGKCLSAIIKAYFPQFASTCNLRANIFQKHWPYP